MRAFLRVRDYACVIMRAPASKLVRTRVCEPACACECMCAFAHSLAHACTCTCMRSRATVCERCVRRPTLPRCRTEGRKRRGMGAG